ncbi:MAG: PLDc_N domain-containing protein [Firmicutes bacterium]|nr:PLDc_N domain-containing protein [Bacillota bacterium]
MDLSAGELLQILLKLWPLVLLQFALMVWALVDLLRRRSTRTLSLPLWIVFIVLINFFGPIAYFLFGRAEQ